MTMTATFGDDEPQPQPFTLSTSADGRVSVTLAGIDIATMVSGVQMTVDAATRVPYVVLEVSPSHTRAVEFDGLARVAVGADPDPGPAAAAFLSAMDAGELERAALNRADLGNDAHAVTAAILAQLIDWAEGRF